LGEAIRIRLFKLTEKPRFAADHRARKQGEDAANSICRNIAEGFGCESHAEFARYLEISRRSLNEVLDVLHAALLQKYITQAELTPIQHLSRRLYPAFSRFIAYLKRTPNPRPKRRNPQPGTKRTDKRREDRTDTDRNRTDKRQ
jgi:four helix bundle protein